MPAVDPAASSSPPPFPGAIGVTHLRVYDSVGPDGLAGGTPHLHTVCTEAYAVIRGHGAVQTLSGEGYREVPLEPGALVWFTPGTVHRLINTSGDLEIHVLMANAGLPEAGDMVITFPDHVLADREAYAGAAALVGDEATTEGTGAAARERRDHAVEGYLERRARVEAGDLTPMVELWARAAALVEPKLGDWRARWEQGPLAAVELTGAQLDALGRGDASHLATSSVHRLDPPGHIRRMGCCGTLGTYVV